MSLIKSIESRLSEIRDNYEEPVLIKQRVTRRKGNSQWQAISRSAHCSNISNVITSDNNS